MCNTLYLMNMVCFRYIIVNTIFKSDKIIIIIIIIIIISAFLFNFVCVFY